MLAAPNEKMGTNEKNEKVFFTPYYLELILWKTGGYPIWGQNVCISYTLSVGLLTRISRQSPMLPTAPRNHEKGEPAAAGDII